jgi:hypothetical protein
MDRRQSQHQFQYLRDVFSVGFEAGKSAVGRGRPGTMSELQALAAWSGFRVGGRVKREAGFSCTSFFDAIAHLVPTGRFLAKPERRARER